MSTGMWGIGFSMVQSRMRKVLKLLVASPMRRRDYLAGADARAADVPRARSGGPGDVRRARPGHADARIDRRHWPSSA